MIKILYCDDDIAVIDKPAGLFVHPPEDPRNRHQGRVNCMTLLRDQLGKYVYPIHRIDRSTSGVVLFALHPEAASILSQSLQKGEMKKTYVAVVRGFVPEEGQIDHPIKRLDTDGNAQQSLTWYQRIAQAEFPFVTQAKFPTTRFSLLHASPITGRQHQIRRHFVHLKHPIVGDRTYGDRACNTAFEKLGITGLLLKAYGLEFEHPTKKSAMWIHSKWNHTWHQVFDQFNVCAYSPRTVFSAFTRPPATTLPERP